MQVQEGKGWRLAHQATRRPFSVLIGGEGWAGELRPEEAQALIDGVRRLCQQREALASALMAEEALCLEIELDLAPGSLWMELDGDPQGWSLRFVLTPADGSRAFEGCWPAAAAMPLMAALEQLRLSLENAMDEPSG
ncbi:MAG: DUF1818 family protein [Synechococcaceae cyanobacterium]|nr:DUF1818 family protein [Synechococcaceae cyanobacterium]